MKQQINEVKRLQQLAGIVNEEAFSSLQDITPSEDDSVDVRDFALKVAEILIDRYGEHNYERFITALTDKLNKV